MENCFILENIKKLIFLMVLNLFLFDAMMKLQ